MRQLYKKLDPDYNLLDLNWNVKPAETKQSYRFVLFDSKPGAESFLRERFIYEKTEEKTKINGGTLEVEPVSLLKIPIKQLFANIDDRKREQEKLDQSGKGNKMDIEFASSSRLNQEAALVRRKRITEAYLPKDFMDLIGSDKMNRFALKWLKSWDFKVFGKKLPTKPQITPDKADLHTYSKYNNSKYNNSKKPTRFAYDLQYQFENLSLTEEKDVKELNSKMLLLSGNSGTGKTTLATVIAKRCGYNPFKVSI